MKRKNPLKKWVIGLGVLSVMLVALHRPILTGLGKFLVVRDELTKADALIILAGDHERIPEAVKLHRQGWAEFMIMTGGKYYPHQKPLAILMKMQAITYGTPHSKILVEDQSNHTFEHPIYTKMIMEKYNFKSAIVVSSPYHMRRTTMLFERYFKGSDIDLIYHPVENSWYRADDWWLNPVAVKSVAIEYVKLIVNACGGRVSRAVVKIQDQIDEWRGKFEQ